MTYPNRDYNLEVYCPKVQKVVKIVPWDLKYVAYDKCPHCGYIKCLPDEEYYGHKYVDKQVVL